MRIGISEQDQHDDNMLQITRTFFKQQRQAFKHSYVNLLEVNNIQKSRVVSCVLIFFHVCFYLSIFAHHDFVLFNPEHIPQILSCFQLFILISVLLFVSSYWLQPTRRSEFIFPILCVGFYSGSLMMVGYIAGMMTILTGVFTMGSILAGLLLFERKIMFYASLPCIAVFYVTTLLTVVNILPYAPLYQAHSMMVVETQTYTLLVNLFATTFIAIVLVMLFNSFLERWRDRERKQQQLMTLDPLTQILNRRGISEQFQRIEQRDTAQRNPLCVAMIDIDFFKKINDQYGHDAGDHVLIRVAQILGSNLREQDHLGRFGGEEFIVIFEQTDIKHAQQILERCRKAIEHHECIYQKHIIRFTASFGLVQISSQDLDEQRVIFSADQQLYRAKHAGRNRICVDQA